MRKGSWKKTASLFMALAMVISMIPAIPAKAEAEVIGGFVMDAEPLSDGSIAVLFVRGGSSSNGVVSGGTLYYGKYTTDGVWTEEAVGEDTAAKEASLALSGDTVHIAFTTGDDKIGYIYQTVDGWSDVETIESMNSGDATDGALYAPDIAVGSDEKVHIAYFDTRGGDSDYSQYNYDDGMCATKASGPFDREVIADGSGWFESSTAREYNKPSKPIKVSVLANNTRVVTYKSVRSGQEGEGNSSKYSDYKIFINGINYEYSTLESSRLFDTCASGTGAYSFLFERDCFVVIKEVNVLKNDSFDNSGGFSAEEVAPEIVGDMAVNGSEIYYAAYFRNRIQTAYGNAFELENDLDTGLNRLSTVVLDGVQHIIYTNTDGNIVIAHIEEVDQGWTTTYNLVEVLPTSKELEDISGVELAATGYSKGTLSGLVEGEDYIITGAVPINATVSDDPAGKFTATGTEEALSGLDPETEITLIKCATSDEKLDSEPATFTVSRATTPELVATQPVQLNGKGVIPTTSAHEYSSVAPGDDPDSVTWTACTEAMQNVEPGTYYVRLKAADTQLASAFQTIEITEYELIPEETPNASFSASGYSKGSLTGLVQGSDYKAQSGTSSTTWNNAMTTRDLDGIAPGELSLIRTGNNSTTKDSEPQIINITRAATPNLTGTDSTTIEGNGSIDSTDVHEYAAEDDYKEATPDLSAWSDCEGTLENLEAGTYYVRVKASGTALASAAQEIVINGPAREEKPSATLTATGADTASLSELISGKEYILTIGSGDPATFTATDDAKTLTGLTPCTVKLVKKGDGGVTTVDSEEQTFTLTKAETPELTAVDPTNRGAKGSIPTTVDHEYTTTDPADASTVWAACTGALTELEEGTYYVRVKASGTVLASDPQTITLTTVNTWIVTYDLNGHGVDIDPVYVLQNTAVTAPDAPTDMGYTFGGWFTDKDCTDGNEWRFDTVLTGDKTLHAKWTANSYTVAFDSNGGTGQMDDQSRTYDDGKTLTPNSFTPPQDKVFSEWNTKADGTGTAYADKTDRNITTKAGETVTLYAQWADEDWGELTNADIAMLKALGKHAADIGDEVWIGNVADVTYTGSNISLAEDELHVYDGKTLLKRGTDYTVSYKNQLNAGPATVIVKGKGNYTQTLTGTFNIEPRTLSWGNGFMITVKDVPYKKDKVQKSSPVIKYGKLTLKEGKDYDIVLYDPAAPTEVGKVRISIKGKGHYEGMLTDLSYNIYTADKSLKNAVITVDDNFDLTYTPDRGRDLPVKSVTIDGKELTAANPLLGPESGDYYVTYDPGCVNAGNTYLTVIGLNEYCGSKTYKYKVKPKELSADKGGVIIVGETPEYSGSALKPAITVMDGTYPVDPSNYTVSYKKSTNVSDTPVITVKLKGNYTGNLTGTFAISPLEIAEDDLTITIPDVKLKKAAQEVTVANLKPVVKYGKKTLSKGKDYDIAFTRAAGDVQTAKITLKGNYKNEDAKVTYDKKFRIYQSADDISTDAFEISLDNNSYVYSGSKCTPAVTVTAKAATYGEEFTLVAGKDYTVSYSNNINVPAKANKQPTVTIKGKGAYKGTKPIHFTISEVELDKLPEGSVKVTAADVKCTGRTLKPKVSVYVDDKLLKAANYSVEYSDTTAVTETGVATVTGKGNYKGTVTGSFRVYKTDITKMKFDKIADQYYTGAQITPGINDTAEGTGNEIRIYTDKTKKTILKPGVDYTMDWGVNVKTGKGTVTIKGMGDFGNSKTVTFKIKPRAVKKAGN